MKTKFQVAIMQDDDVDRACGVVVTTAGEHRVDLMVAAESVPAIAAIPTALDVLRARGVPHL